MTKEEMLVSLSGQVVNGIMSSNNSLLAKVLESSFHDQVADISFAIAKRLFGKIVSDTK